MSPNKVMSPEEYYNKISKEDKDAIINLKNRPPIDFIPSGSWVINFLIGDGSNKGKPGGLPRGHIIEVMGDESSGKTTLALSGCKQAQLQGGIAVFIDFERSFHEQYAKNLGIDLNPNKFILIEPRDFEHGARLMVDALMMKPAIIVVDSVSAMIPRQFLEGQVDEAGRIGLQAQLMSQFLTLITKKIPETNTCLLFTNQLRSVIKKSKYDTGPEEESSGGRALRFYSSVRLKMRKSTVEKIPTTSKITGKSDKEPVNMLVKVTAIKNKIDKPWLQGPVFIRFGEGFDNILSVIELAVNTGVIKKSGAFYKFQIGDEVIFNSQGKENLRSLLVENSNIYSKLRESLVFKEDEQAKKESQTEDTSEADEVEKALAGVSKTYVEKQKSKRGRKRDKS